MKRKIVVAVTGASGAIYAKILFEKLREIKGQLDEVGVIFSTNALDIWKYELKEEFDPVFPFHVYEKDDFYAPFASGSANFDTLIICPCSMGTIGRIAHGVSNDLISRTADVMLKERRNLILVPRETPFNLIHLENMKTITLGGGIICPATPSFYSKPETIIQVVETVVERILNLAGFEIESFQWGKFNPTI
ncbi:MAG: UbiX family flavin prenyltransferase [Prolixibacteraceae bacterium]|jgi:flavin prenyltransferase|nr:UbiX family flavin prenyltransferase [Prolixibacteraceae bacterium]MBT6006014.1 UbiX family flavin prenyltransferase [Prolixibacteraceae bacterium]MBT6763839.1 UbiX family flavin prenyltransferase [Prolixibacteraceae bacterium]MBT7000591.1 UbiX family flavin prenyltransferase [Prolixibacteraceae bacterium]MBT7394529.1 UbiX family flavin prenyltransferase [Prolixibacteraceae bacterium]